MSDVCKPDVYANGTCIDVVDATKDHLEWACKETERRSGAAVDWHYVGGRGRVLALGDIAKAAEIFVEVMDGGPPEGCLRIDDEREGQQRNVEV